MFGETKLTTPYFQQMTLHSKIPKNNSHSVPKMEWNMNYFECQLFCSTTSPIIQNLAYFSVYGKRLKTEKYKQLWVMPAGHKPIAVMNRPFSSWPITKG